MFPRLLPVICCYNYDDDNLIGGILSCVSIKKSEHVRRDGYVGPTMRLYFVFGYQYPRPLPGFDFCLTVHHQLGKVIQMNQLDATMIY